MKKATITAILCFCLTGCASKGIGVGMIKESVLSEVEKCQFVKNVSGTRGRGGLAASVGIENAKEQAKGHAFSAGATHIVWQAINGGFSPSVSANAYNCNK